MDQACVTTQNFLKQDIKVYFRSAACVDCPYEYQYIRRGDSWTAKWDTNFPSDISISQPNNLFMNESQVCSLLHKWVEGEEYNLSITQRDSSTDLCDYVAKGSEKWDFLLPLYVGIGVLLFAILAWIGAILCFNRVKRTRPHFRLNSGGPIMQSLRDETSASDVETTPHSGSRRSSFIGYQPLQPQTERRRWESLDAFRGLAILLMIFVNYGGAGYWFFNHSIWNGLTWADLPFPWFIFIMGSSMAFGNRRHFQSPTPVPFISLLIALTRRSVILCLLGIALNSASVNGDLTRLRLPGVLQRFAVTNFLVGGIELIVLFLRSRYRRVRSGAAAATEEDGQPSVLRRGGILLPYFLVIAVLLTLHAAITLTVSQGEECPTGYVGPGGWHQQSKYANCTGGIAGIIDRIVFGDAHIYQTPTCQSTYRTTVPFDPEGLLGCITSVALCLFGLIAGKVLYLFIRWVTSVQILLVLGVITTLAGLGLSSFTLQSGWIPINKNLWSVSYVLVNAGGAYFLFSLFFVLVDGQQLWNGAPFVFPGKNSIFLYMAHEVFAQYMPVFFAVPTSHTYLLMLNSWSVTFWTLVAYFMWRKKVFVRVM